MTMTTLKTHVLGHCIVDLSISGNTYTSTRLPVLKNICSDLIFGQNFQKQQHKSVIEFDGSNPELVITKTKSVSALSVASIGEPSLFANLLCECKPIATKSRALVVVVKDPLQRHKK